MNKKALALLLAAVLCFGCFAGCGSDNAEVTPTPEATPTPTPQPTPEAAPEAQLTVYDLAYDAYAPETVVMTVNGIDVHWEEYYYWIGNMAKQVAATYGVTDWSHMVDATYSYEGFVQAYAQDILTQYWVVEDKAAELNVTLSEEDQSYIDQVYQQDVTTYGGGDEAAFAEYLESSHISPKLYRRMMELSQLYAKIFEHLLGQAGSGISDEDAMSYAENAGYLRAKHILIMTLDAEGKAMTDEDKAGRKAIAQEVYDELAAITDEAEFLSRFDDLMYEYSDDTGLAANPDGYYFLPGEMVTQFEEGTKALEMHAMSEIIESPYGYHIILRLPLELDATIDYSTGYTLRYLAATAVYENMMADWFTSAEIVYAEGFESLSFNELFAPAESAS